MNSRLYSCLALLALALGAPAQSPPVAQKTAFALAREGDNFIAPQAKGNLTQIHSDKSSGSLAPEVWHINYFDSTAPFKTTEVTFVAGKMTEVKQPRHLFDSVKGTQRMDWKKLKVDSDRALAFALKEPRLKKLHLRATQFWLESMPAGPAWKMRFWAARPDKPDQTTEIGDIYLSTKTGAILKNDLHLPKE